MAELFFTIPTYRHRDVHNCVKEYFENFEEHRSHIPIIVFDDSPAEKSMITLQNLQKVKQMHPNADIRYIGPSEKGVYLSELEKKDSSGLVSEMLQPSYGGNRNWILLATMGHHFISVDDDMHPHGYFDEPRKSNPSSVLEGTYSGTTSSFSKKGMDIVNAYQSMIGRRVGEYIRQNPAVRTGGHLVDSNMNLELNMTSGELKDNEVTIAPDQINPDAKIKIVQSFLSGDADIDSKDLINEFLKSHSGECLNGVVPLKYGVKSFDPCIVSEDYRITGAVLGLDNSEGFICFLPTKLRFEDYIFRHYCKKPDIHVGYCPAVQTHERAMANRNSIVRDYVIEGVATIIKKAIINGVSGISELEVKLSKSPSYNIGELYGLWQSLIDFSKKVDLSNRHGEAFYDMIKEEAVSMENAGEFVAKYAKKIDEEYTKMRHTIKLWPLLVEYARRNPVSQTFVKN